MANGWSIIFGAVIVAAFCAVSWFAAPKGETRDIWRSSLLISAVACYLMWAITFFAQWHPLIAPERTMPESSEVISKNKLLFRSY